jgi:23S rRNA (uracil1939-C5)-methyltransferase
MVYNKNQIIEVTIEDIGVDGEGIGHIDGYTFFIKDAIIGDTVSAKVMKASKNFAYARLEKVISPSPFRVTPKCDIARSCGGCQIQALSYEKQLEYKQNKVRNNLKRIGGFDEKLLDWVTDKIVGMDEPWNYRNKAVYPIGYNKDGKLIAGFYAGRTHSIIAGSDCFIGDPGNKKILDIILAHMEKYHITAYNEETGEGEVRHVLLRKGFTSGEWMVSLILNQRLDKKADAYRTKSNREESLSGASDSSWITQKDFIKEQGELLGKLSEIKGMTSVSVNINNEKTNVILGKETYCIWGKPYIKDSIGVRDMTKPGYPKTGRSLEFHISPQSFYQVNPVQTEKLYSLALEYAGLTGKEAVWDLYCGIGTISLFLAGNAGQIYGVEVIDKAIEDARNNAKRNGISNAKFFVGKAEEVLPQFYNTTSPLVNASANTEKKSGKADMRNPDVIVVDPPRKGCDEECLRTMVAMAPERIVYVSCDSATLARDLKYLCSNGYNLRKVRPVDMFPHTVHVECCVALQKANG